MPSLNATSTYASTLKSQLSINYLLFFQSGHVFLDFCTTTGDIQLKSNPQ